MGGTDGQTRIPAMGDKNALNGWFLMRAPTALETQVSHCKWADSWCADCVSIKNNAWEAPEMKELTPYNTVILYYLKAYYCFTGMSVLPACMYVMHIHARCRRRPEEGVTDMSHHMDAGNWTKAFCQSSPCSSHLSWLMKSYFKTEHLYLEVYSCKPSYEIVFKKLKNVIEVKWERYRFSNLGDNNHCGTEKWTYIV